MTVGLDIHLAGKHRQAPENLFSDEQQEAGYGF
jgi:hypothetical protein